MNLLLIAPGDLVAPTRARVEGRRAEHLRAVLRVAPGDTLVAGLIDGRIGRAVVCECTPEAVTVELTLERDPPPPAPVTLILALPRPPSFRKALAAATAMGVKRVAVIHAARVEKSYWQSPTLAAPAVHEQLCLALEQARDTVLPTITWHRRFRAFADDVLPALAGEAAVRLVAHPDGATPCPRTAAGATVLAVGPEGGFLDHEIAAFIAAGFAPVTLGPRVLRVEHAVPVLLALVGSGAW